MRFDYSGHGQSSGAFRDGTIGRWTDDALAALDRLTHGPQVLVGSSMGGWIMLLVALARPDRIAGLVGIAAAPDFTEDLMWAQMQAETSARLMAERGGRDDQWIWGRNVQAATVISLLTPEYQKRMVQMNYHEAVSNAPQWMAAFCYPEGLMRWWAQFTFGGPIELMMSPYQVQFLSGSADNLLRRVLIGRKHVQEVPQWYGETVGFWNGETLVAWTDHVQGWSMSHALPEFSSELEAIEVFTRDANRNIHLEITIYDPEAFVSPLRLEAIYRYLDGPASAMRYQWKECQQALWNVDGRLQPIGVGEIQVDLHDLVVEGRGIRPGLGVRHQVGAAVLGERGDVGTIRRAEIRRHPAVEREDGRRGAELGAHVADRPLAGGADRLHAGTEVLEDLVGAALHGEQRAQIGDDVLGRRPAADLAGEVDADEHGVQHLPGQAGHGLAAVRAAHADGHHAEAARVRRVAVGADHHPAGERVLLEHDLMDDAAARLPEPDAVLRRHALEEVVDLAVDVERELQVVLRADMRLDQVVAVHGGRHRDR